MDIAIHDTPIINEEIWSAWVRRGQLREKATARKAKMLAAIALILLAMGSAFYLLAMR
jgi:hypothetical protein